MKVMQQKTKNFSIKKILFFSFLFFFCSGLWASETVNSLILTWNDEANGGTSPAPPVAGINESNSQIYNERFSQRLQRLHLPKIQGKHGAAGVQEASPTLRHKRVLLSGRSSVVQLPYAMTLKQARAYAKSLFHANEEQLLRVEPDEKASTRITLPKDPYTVYPEDISVLGAVEEDGQTKWMKAPFVLCGQNGEGETCQWWLLPSSDDCGVGKAPAGLPDLIPGTKCDVPLFATNVMNAWDTVPSVSPTTGPIVAVVDSGYVPHKDMVLVPNNSVAGDTGKNFVSRGVDVLKNSALDSSRDDALDGMPVLHGLAVSSIISAPCDDAGLAGVTCGGGVYPIRVVKGHIDDSGAVSDEGSLSDIVDGLSWVINKQNPFSASKNDDHRIRVVNMSLGSNVFSECPASLQEAISKINEAGASVVVASGNSAKPAGKYWPSNCRGVISVSSVDPCSYYTGYTNLGPANDIAAPGGINPGTNPAVAVCGANVRIEKMFTISVASVINIPKTEEDRENKPFGDEGISNGSGTSFSAPMVSGVLSLMYSTNPDLTPKEAYYILMSTSQGYSGRIFTSPGEPLRTDRSCTSELCGYGMLDAAAAVTAAANAVHGSVIPDDNPFDMDRGTGFRLTMEDGSKGSGGGGSVSWQELLLSIVLLLSFLIGRKALFTINWKKRV